MKTKEEFIHAGQELYDVLKSCNLRGIGRHGEQAGFSMSGEDVSVEPEVSPPYGYEIGLRDFIEGLGMGIAVNKGEKLGSIFADEVDVLIGAVLLPLRRDNARHLMDGAIQENSRVRRLGEQLTSLRHLEPCVDAVAAEESARDTAFYIDTQYARYEALAVKLEPTGGQA